MTTILAITIYGATAITECRRCLGRESQMKIEIDRRSCLKSGQCSYLHPELFERDAEDFPIAKIEQVEASLIEGAEEAVELCPASALTLVDAS